MVFDVVAFKLKGGIAMCPSMDSRFSVSAGANVTPSANVTPGANVPPGANITPDAKVPQSTMNSSELKAMQNAVVRSGVPNVRDLQDDILIKLGLGTKCGKKLKKLQVRNLDQSYLFFLRWRI